MSAKKVNHITAAAKHYRAAETALRTGCAEALLTGLHLIAIHAETAHHGGDRHSLLAEDGFTGALQKIGIKRPTAYRWMNACANALERAELIPGADSVSECLPGTATKDWQTWEKALQTIAQGTSLNRLLLGANETNSDLHRQDKLITAAEQGEPGAEEILQQIADGKLTLTQAIRAASGALATKGKQRNDPVYLDYDARLNRPVGLLPKALTTLRNGFSQWDHYSDAARQALRDEWHATRLAMPDELFTTKTPKK